MAGGIVREKIKGVLQKIKLFAFKINYNTLNNNQTDVIKLYNGNIAETRWRTNFDNLTRSYGYTYDALNRLTNAQYVRPSNPNNPNPADIINTFNEQLSYDKNGNIKTLVRNGGMESQTTVPVMDILTYGYSNTDKNKLIKVTDATANTDGFKDGADTTEEYGYDPNGNMIRDDNKNIRSIVYNHLNLPTKIVFQNGGDFPSISYLYTATGKKVAKTVNIASRNSINYTVDYLDGYQYESGKLLFFPTAEGYVKYTEGVSNPFDYVFNYTDHLGNIRLSYGINPGTGLLKKMEENNYYPFGLKHGSYNTEKMIIVPRPEPGPAVSAKFMMQKIDVLAAAMELPPGELITPEIYSGYNYKYQGQERQDELGLNWDSFKWRNYDYAIGRFMSIDPLTEEYNTWSPYTFSGNRVIDARELEGLEPYILFGSENKALMNFGQQYNGKSIKQGVEYGSNVYKTTAADGKTYFYYDSPNKGDEASVSYPSTLFERGDRVSTVHAHGEYLEKFDNNNFSPADKKNAENRGVDNNIVTPDGSLKNYDVKTNKETVTSTNMPSDPKDPDRKNTVAPNENPAPVKTTPIVPKKVEVKTTGEIEYHHGRVM